MRYIITLFALLVFCTVNSKVTVQTKNDPIENKITQLDKKVNSIENNYKDNIIQEYKDLNNIYSIGFTVLLALFGAIFPFIFYFFQYKPAIEAKNKAELLLNNLEKNFEKSFEEHINKSKNKIIDKAIESFELQEEENFSDSMNNIQKYQKETFTEKQIKRLIALLKRTDINSENKNFITGRLTFQKSEEIENYFVDLIRNDPKDKRAGNAIDYLAKVNNKSHYDLITNVLIENEFDGMLYIFLRAKWFVYDFFNYKRLIIDLSEEQISKWCSNIESDTKHNFDLGKISKTLMWNKYLEIKSNKDAQ